MLTSRKAKKVLSLLITIVMIMGSFTSFAYAESDQFSLAKVELHEVAQAKIEPAVMQDLEKEDLVEIMVYMSDQVDTENVAKATEYALSSSMTPYSLNLAVRNAVVEALRDKAEMTQANLLRYLEQEMERGNVEEYTSYYLVNMLYVKATKEVVEQISFMNEVEKIYKNKTHTMEFPKIENVDIEPQGTEPMWNITRVGADAAWDMGYDGTGAVVGSLDSGVDWTHPALKNKWRGYDPATGATDPSKNWFDPVYNATLPADSDSHGTHVMGTMVGVEPDGNNPIGVAPGAKWITARVFNTAGSTTDNILLSAAQWMVAPGGDTSAAPDVVNNSWGGGAGIDDWYKGAVENWRNAKIFPVFSAGNQRSGEPAPWPGSISCPANYIESFAVAAVDRYDIRASFSKLGPSPYDPSVIKPNISGPGVSIYSSIPGGYTGGYSGTSMSAPHVSGVVALLRGADKSLTINDIWEILQDTAEPLVDSTYPNAPNMAYGYGMVNAFEAVSQIATGTGYISGRVLGEGEDTEEPVIIHNQEVFETFMGSDIEITAQIIDDVAITEAELLVKQPGKSYWMLAPMNKISGDYKDGIYKGTITYDMLGGDSIIYKIRARDFAGETVVTQDYNIEIAFGVLPGYTQGFESAPMGWIMDSAWEWGKPSGNDPLPVEGENLAGTKLGTTYPTNADDWMITPPMDLRDDTLPSASLRFSHWYNMENNYDKGYVLVTNDFGATWTQVGPIYTNLSNEWKGVVVNLNEYIGSENPVFVAFRFTSDGSVVRQGWYIDNVKFVGIDTEAPAMPADLAAEPGLTGINLSWSPVADADLLNYVVYRSLTSGEGFEQIAEPTNNGFVDTAVEGGVTYYYKVAAKDMAGNISELTEEVFSSVSEITIIFSTDFEVDDGGFTLGVTAGTVNDWQWGIPTSGPNGATSGEKLWATNLSGNYTARSDAYIMSPDIVIPEDKNPVLTFSHWYDFEGTATGTWWDYGKVEVSKDDGATWTNITPGTKGQYGTRLQTWLDEEIPLIGYNGDTIKVRFFFHSDGSGQYAGWYVDDVYVVGLDMPQEDPQIAPEVPFEEELKKADYVDPIEPNYSLIRTEVNNYETVEDIEVQNTPMVLGGIPIAEAYVTILETGRTVKVEPMTGKYNMRVPMGDYTLIAEAYGYYPSQAIVTVLEEVTSRQSFVLEAKPQGSITGRVFDRYWENVIPNATVRLVEDSKIAPVVTDANGNFEIPAIYVGDYTLKVTAEGYFMGEFDVTVEEDIVTEVELGLKISVDAPAEIKYDDGTAENALVLNAAPNGLAVRFTPSGHTNVMGANVYFWGTDWPSPGGNRIGFTIYGTNENGSTYKVGEPIFMDITRGAWNNIDLSTFGFSTDRDFYISTIQDRAGTSCPGTGIDETGPGDRSYLNIDGEFELMSSEGITGALMIRAIVGKAVDSPVITNLGELSYTNQDVIMVEGTVQADCKVNIYVNGEIAAFGDTTNRAFAIEVELTEETSLIMATAELNNRQTEPSPVITVIKDQDPPVLVVDSPVDGAKINKEAVHVIGNVNDDKGLAKLLVNEVEVEVDEDGNFHERLMVNQGENLFTIKAIDKAGNETIVERIVFVDLNIPEITNIEPAEDVTLKTGETLNVSFNAPTGGEGYFRILLPYSPQNNEIGIPMIEVDGLYSGTWIVPAETEASSLLIEVVYISEFGYEVVEQAEGRLIVVIEGEDPGTDPDPEPTGIQNLEPTQDITLRAGETLEISFNAPEGGEAYYRVLLPFTPTNDNPGNPMIEVSPGFYKATLITQNDVSARNLQIEVLFRLGNENWISKIAQGKLTIIGDIQYLPSNTVIVGNEAYDIKYLNADSNAQIKLISHYNSGQDIYIKLNANTVVNIRGEIVNINSLPQTLKYFDANGYMLMYSK